MLFDAQGREIRKVSDTQLVSAIQALNQRTQALQLQMVQMGILLEYFIEQLSLKAIDGVPLLDMDETRLEEFQKKRFGEIQAEASEFQRLIQESKTNSPTTEVNLEE